MGIYTINYTQLVVNLESVMVLQKSMKRLLMAALLSDQFFQPLGHTHLSFLFIYLTLSWRRFLSYRNQSVDLLRQSMGWFLYDKGLRHERVKGLTSNEYNVKDSFDFAKEILQQNSDWFMASLDITSLFTSIPLNETINICSKELFDKIQHVSNLDRGGFEKLLRIVTKDIFHFR